MVNLPFGKNYRDERKLPEKQSYELRVKPYHSRNHTPDSKKARKYVSQNSLRALFSVDKNSLEIGISYIALSKQISCPDELIHEGLVKKIQVNRFDEVYVLTKRGEGCVKDIMKYASQRLRK